MIGLAAGLGVAEAVEHLTGVRTVLKWPNDLLLDGRKLCGLLVDLATDGPAIRYAILGVGINVSTPLEVFSTELRQTVTTLRAGTGKEISVDQLLAIVLERIEAQYERLMSGGAELVLRDWQRWPNMLGQKVRLVDARGAIDGIAEGLDRDGALLLRLESGQVQRTLAGDVHLLAGH